MMRRDLAVGFVGLVTFLLLAIGPAGDSPSCRAAQLLIGVAEIDITPELPAALSGQHRTRIAKKAETPITASVVALEARNGQQVVDQAVIVSCEVVTIREGILELVRKHAGELLPEVDMDKVFLSATHTHTAPVLLENRYEIPDQGVLRPAEYAEFFAQRVAEAIKRAWESRRSGAVSWGLGHAVVAQNRRAVYADGKARMYGNTNDPNFRRIEGYEDHGVGSLFFWGDEGQLLAVAVDVACPAQEVESRSAVNADFWHEVRANLRKRYGQELCVLGWIGAAGDQSPHLMYRKRAEERMRQLRGLNRLEEIARRITAAVDDVYEVGRKQIESDVAFAHLVKKIDLPRHPVSKTDYNAAKKKLEELLAKEKAGDNTLNERRGPQRIVDRYEQQQEPYPIEVHVLRLGEVAICTNPFELFTDFGIQIQDRSDAVHTFVIQLAGPGGYLPTQRAIDAGGYGATPSSSVVGPEGGQVLVEETVGAIEKLFDDPQ